MGVIESLKTIDSDDNVRLTIDGEAYEGYVVEQFYEPWERDQWGGINGEIIINIELANETDEAHGLPSHQIDIRARETKENEWTDPSVAIWDPVVEDGTVVRDEYTPMGDLESVEVLEEQ